MRRSWPTFLLIAGTVAVIGLLGVLQYQWLKRISEADGEKDRAHISEQTERFAQDFNREIQNAFFNFQIDPHQWEAKDWTEFNKRYKFWKERAEYPDLISGFYFFGTAADSPLLKYDLDKGEFLPTESDADLKQIRAMTGEGNAFRPAIPELNSLVLPVAKPEISLGPGVLRLRERQREIKVPDRFGYIVIRLDSSVITGQLLADLTQKYFGDHEFTASVISPDGKAIYNSLRDGTPDATARLFDLSPDNMIFYANKELMSSLDNRKTSAGVTIDSHMETRTFNRVESGHVGNSTLKLEVKGVPRTSVFTTTGVAGGDPNSWVLTVQHSSGSLDAHIAAGLRRNLAIGFGLLLLLAGAIIAIVVSSMRARALARRQIAFVSSVSHEFRTPLAVIYSAGENLADGVANDPRQVTKYGDLVKGEGRKLSAMVEQILEFAGANSGRRKFNFAEIEVKDVVAAAINECRTQIEETQADVDVNVAESLPTIRGDRSALVQAVANLIANSIKYGNGSKRVMVAASNGNSTVKIAVEDRGIGISKADLKQIFKPFYRSKEVVDAQIHGNGLGLSLVKQVAEAHGGRVTAESEVGTGSKFTIELPQS